MTPPQLHAILREKVRRLLADALTWSEGRFFYEATEALHDPEDDLRRARREDKRGIVVAVDLKAMLEQLLHETPPAIGPMVDDTLDDGLAIDVEDDDVVETLPALGE